MLFFCSYLICWPAEELLLRAGAKSFALRSLGQMVDPQKTSDRICAGEGGGDGTVSVPLCVPGEGFHNYHHTFPFDYSASELGLNFNPTTWFIDFMCLLGLATDRKRATKPMIEARKAKTGDGTA